MSQRKKMCDRQKFINENFCKLCVNYTVNSPDKWCDGCNHYKELRKIGDGFMELSKKSEDK